jgi:hypothetical protein
MISGAPEWNSSFDFTYTVEGRSYRMPDAFSTTTNAPIPIKTRRSRNVFPDPSSFAGVVFVPELFSIVNLQ